MFASAWVCEEVDLDRRFTDRLLARRRVLRHRHCMPASSNSNKSLQPRSRRNNAQCAWRPGINLSTFRSVISPNFIKGRLITFINMWYASVLQCFDAVSWAAGRASRIRPVKHWVVGAGVVVCLGQGADLHVAQLMPLPLTVSCFTKIQIGFTWVVPEKGPLNGCVSVIC